MGKLYNCLNNKKKKKSGGTTCEFSTLYNLSTPSSLGFLFC